VWEQRYVDDGRASSRSSRSSVRRSRSGSSLHGSRGLAVPAEGHDVGGSWEELVAVADLQQDPSGCSGPYLEYVEESREAVGAPGTMKISVEFRPSEDSSIVESIAAPVRVNGCD
jgi:hypothetical protein